MPAKASTRKRKGAPKWSSDPFRQFLDDADRLQDVVGLSSSGISMIRSIPQAIEALNMSGVHDEQEGAERLEVAKSPPI